jgi:opacity protein-like surface antigen
MGTPIAFPLPGLGGQPASAAAVCMVDGLVQAEGGKHMRLRKVMMISALSLVLLPATASAQNWFFTPFVGANFGGNATFGNIGDFEDNVERRIDFGATLGWNPAIVGWEIDFGWSPNFFENTTGDSNFEFGDSNVTTLMANINFMTPNRGQGVRPYGSAGVGLIRSSISGVDSFFNDLATNDFGMNIGGGVQGNFNDNVGIRGDIRYFRSLQDNEPDGELDLGLSNFDFWRGTVGVSFQW